MTILYVVAGLIIIVYVLNVLSRKRVEGLKEKGLFPEDGEATMNDVARLAQAGHKIEAIKVYRELNGVDLKTAKDEVEKLIH